MTADTTPRYSLAAHQATAKALFEAEEARCFDYADEARVALDAAHDPQLGPNRSVNAQQHRAEIIREICAWLEQPERPGTVYAAVAKQIRREFGTP